MNLKRILTAAFAAITLTSVITGTTFAEPKPDTDSPQPPAMETAVKDTDNATHDADFSPKQVESIEKIVKNYLINKPQVLLEASVALRKQMQKKQQEQAMQAIKENQQALFNDSQSPVAGNPQGTVVMVEFFDYQCPHCKEVNKIVTNLIDKNKNLKLVMKDWPIFSGASAIAAKAALAAHQQNKYMEMHEALLEAKNPLTKAKIMKIAKHLGLNMKKLKQDMDSKQTEEKIAANFALAKKLGLVGTPAFILTDKNEQKFKFIPGSTTEENLQNLVDELSS